MQNNPQKWVYFSPFTNDKTEIWRAMTCQGLTQPVNAELGFKPHGDGEKR